MEPIKPTDYHRIVKPKSPTISSTGMIAFVRQQPRDGKSYRNEIIQLGEEGTVGGSGRDANPTWGPDGSLVFSRDHPDDSRGSDLWILRQNGDSTRLTQTAGDVSDVAWAPNGDLLAFVQRSTPDERKKGLDLESPADYARAEPDPRVVERLVYRGQGRYFNGERSHIYIYNLRDETIDRATDGDSDFVGPEFGGADTLFYSRKQGDDADNSIRFDVVKYDLDSGDRSVVTESASTARPGTSNRHPALAATADNRLALTYTHGRDDPPTRKTEIRIVDPEGNNRFLTDELDRTVEEGIGLEWGQDTEYVFFVTPDEGDYVLRRVDVNDKTIQTLVDNGHVDGFAVNKDRAVFTRSDCKHPGDVFSIPAEGGEIERLTELNRPYLNGHMVSEPEEIWFESDGNSVQGWLLLPPETDSTQDEYPLVVEIHGGPHTMWSTSGTMWHEFQMLAASGYAVFWSNPRGSRGYGQRFARATVGDWGGTTLEDILAGVDTVVERSDIDEDNTFVTGGSFGGYMVGWTVGHTNRFDAAIAQRGIYDISLWYGTTDGSKQVDFDFDATPWGGSDVLRQQSPANYIDEITTPTLILHSEVDYRVPIANSEVFFAYLKKAGVPAQLIRYPREGHGLSRSGEPTHVVDRLKRIRRWFAGYSDYHEAEPVLTEGWGRLDETTRPNRG